MARAAARLRSQENLNGGLFETCTHQGSEAVTLAFTPHIRRWNLSNFKSKVDGSRPNTGVMRITHMTEVYIDCVINTYEFVFRFKILHTSNDV